MSKPQSANKKAEFSAPVAGGVAMTITIQLNAHGTIPCEAIIKLDPLECAREFLLRELSR